MNKKNSSRMRTALVAALVAFVGLALAPSAQAETVSNTAQIPPTAECGSKFRELFEEYAAKMRRSRTDDEEEKADRELTRGLADAGCISDAEPLFKDMKAKPFTPKCVESAAAAEEYWQGPTQRLEAASAKFSAPIQKNALRTVQLKVNLGVLREQGGSAAQRRQLRQRIRELRATGRKLSKSRARTMVRIAWPHAYENFLVLAELLSRRCVGPSILVYPSTQKGPGAQTVARNENLIWISIFSIMKRVDGIEAQAPRALPQGMGLFPGN